MNSDLSSFIRMLLTPNPEELKVFRLIRAHRLLRTGELAEWPQMPNENLLRTLRALKVRGLIGEQTAIVNSIWYLSDFRFTDVEI